ncbi:hypothetical protein NUH88_00760 [Nisaea acidiphila]|uniref:Uncharacterized protein n=1 Tax=Nisaea acidiphila TaxID=1862145 RepID=A0A9J7ASU2_9PROT|nr:hypothetical protein [Nisaea acidiphila]UUX50238.1 hypothetical protein NUH88_00760 [Nisaea acidiphila]
MCFLKKLKFPKAVALAVLLALPVTDALGAGDEPEGITVSKRDCRRVVAYQASGDVDYKPGVDARGNPVKGADLPGSVIIETPKTITIPLTLELADLFTLPAGMSAEAGVGTVKYDIGSGKLEYNGQPLTDPQMAAIAAACAKMKK